MDVVKLRSFRQWRPLQPELLWAYDGGVDPRVRHHLAIRTGRMSAWLMRRGRVRLVSDDVVLNVAAGDWVFFSGGFQRHDFSRDARLLSVSLLVPAGAETTWRHEPFKVAAAENPRLERVAKKLAGEAVRHDPAVASNLQALRVTPADYLRLTSLGQAWAAEYAGLLEKRGMTVQAPRRQDARVAEAVRLLEATAFQRGFSEARLAKAVKLSAGHLERLFQRETGVTPRQLWERRRKEEAEWRVPHTETPLKQLAFELGFCSQAHFSGWYRRTFGVSATAQRGEARKLY